MINPARAWPALMDLQTAADYLTLSPGSVAGLLRRQGVMPVELGLRRRRWKRCDLDLVITKLPHLGIDQYESCQTEIAAVDYALAAVERRIARRRQTTGGAAREVRQSRSPA